MADVKLDLLFLDSHSCYSMVVADISTYPSDFNIVSPTIEITTPSGEYVTLPFTAKSVNIYDSLALHLTCDGDDLEPLPDGIYQFKYTITPATDYFITKTIIRTNTIQESLDNAYMKLDMDCSGSKEDEVIIQDIEYTIKESIAAANSCAQDLSMKLYRIANNKLSRFNNNKCCI